MKTATFMMGGIASGKTTVRDALISEFVPKLDADEFKRAHPDFDPNNCTLEVHRHSMRRLAEAFAVAVESETESFAMDGTGISVERMLSQMDQARMNGFRIRLICVLTPQADCLSRNAARDRTVDPDVIRSKNPLVPFALEAVAPFADVTVVVDNAGPTWAVMGGVPELNKTKEMVA